jgi:L-fucose mutarotase
MLNGIPKILSPDLLKIIMEMGHGDELVIADGNFPAASLAQRLVRLDGHPVPGVLDAILQFFPLDTFEESPVVFMAVASGDSYTPKIWGKYRKIIEHRSGHVKIETIERYAFYSRTRQAYAVVATSETARYANVILKKGLVI